MNHHPTGRCSYGPSWGGHMRAHYIARWSGSSHPKLRNVSSRIAVAVREASTYLAREPVFGSLTKIITPAARPRGVRRVDVRHGYSRSLRLVGNKPLQLPPRPPVQACAQALTHSNTRADVRQVLQYNRAATVFQGLPHDFCANLVIDVAHMAGFAAGDSREQLFCRLRAVALNSPAQRHEAIARVSELPTSIQGSKTCSGRYVFAQVDAKRPRTGRGCCIGQFQDDVQIPTALPFHEICLANCSALEIAALKGAHRESNLSATTQRVKRHTVIPQPIGSSIDVYGRGWPECYLRVASAVRAMGFQTACRSCNRIALHLRSQVRKQFAEHVVREVVQPNAVRAAVHISDSRRRVARGPEYGTKRGELRDLLGRGSQTNCDSACHGRNCRRHVCHTVGTITEKERRVLSGLNAEDFVAVI